MEIFKLKILGSVTSMYLDLTAGGDFRVKSNEDSGRIPVSGLEILD